jgi:hypothetical protein
MQTRPDHPALLDALAQFLLADVGPSLEGNKALQFRVLIAANLASVVASEMRTEPARFTREVSRLKQLLSKERVEGLESTERETRLLALEGLNRELASKLRTQSLEVHQQQQALEHLIATAKETLEVTNPRFDLTHEG